MSTPVSGSHVRIRIVVDAPPPEVQFAVQRGRSDLLEPSLVQGTTIQFDFALRTGAPLADGTVNFLGEFSQGPPSDRFVYLNAGTLAGQAGSCWTRRAKLKLAGIPAAVVEEALASGQAIQARVVGTMPDGGPVCASIKPQAVAWSLVRDAA